MSYKLRNLLTSVEFEPLEENLRNKFKNRYHCRAGSKSNIDFYCIAWVKPDVSNIIYGHISGPNMANATFEVSKEGLYPRYKITPESHLNHT